MPATEGPGEATVPSPSGIGARLKQELANERARTAALEAQVAALTTKLHALSSGEAEEGEAEYTDEDAKKPMLRSALFLSADCT